VLYIARGCKGCACSMFGEFSMRGELVHARVAILWSSGMVAKARYSDIPAVLGRETLTSW
jgi:hypothetical protein